LGMSGSLRVLPADTPLRTHDHVDIALEAAGRHSARVLRFNDPRRFGCLLWQPPGETHELLADLGPEPLSDRFDGDYLFAEANRRMLAEDTQERRERDRETVEAWYRAQGRDRAMEVEGAREKLLAKLEARSK